MAIDLRVGCTTAGPAGARTDRGQRRDKIAPQTAYVQVSGIHPGQERPAAKPSARPTPVRAQYLPPTCEIPAANLRKWRADVAGYSPLCGTFYRLYRARRGRRLACCWHESILWLIRSRHEI